MPGRNNCTICSRPLPQDGVCAHCSTQKIQTEKAKLPALHGYRMLRSLGEGGMGAIFLAEDQSLGREVAVKMISGKLSREPDALPRFKREARAMATVSHPNIVHVHSLSEQDGQAYIVMEYVEGENLAHRIRRMGRLTVDETLRVTRQVAEALDAAWEKKIVHRDIKPSNILIDKKGRVRVADFGLAKPLGVDGDSSLTQAGHLLGTPHYLSPEQARGLPLDFRSDVYSLGIVLYEMLVGEPPYEGATPYSLVDKHLHEPLPSVIEKRADCPDPVLRLLSCMTAKDPSQRPDYATLLATLDEMVRPSGSTPLGSALGPPTPPPGVSPWDPTEQRRDPVDATQPPRNDVADITDRKPRAAPSPSSGSHSGRSQSDWLKWAAGALSLLLVITMTLRGMRMRSSPSVASVQQPPPAGVPKLSAGSPPGDNPPPTPAPAPPTPMARAPVPPSATPGDEAGSTSITASRVQAMPQLAVMYVDDSAADRSLQAARIGMILSDAFVQILNDVAGLRVVSPSRIDSVLRMMGRSFDDTGRDLELARQVCGKTDATMFLVGSLSHVGRTYVLSATLTEYPSQKLLGSFRATAKSEDAILDALTSKTASELKAAVAAATGATLGGGRRVSKVATISVDAYTHYVRGLDLVLEGQYQEAVDELDQAVKIDPTMAVAWSELACAQSFNDENDKARQCQRKALVLLDHLSEKEKVWVQCNSLWIDGAPGNEFISCQQKFIDLYPDDRNGYLYTGFAERWLNKSCDKALPFYEQAYQLTPTYFAITKEITECSIELGHRDKAIAALDRYLDLARSGHGHDQAVNLLASIKASK